MAGKANIRPMGYDEMTSEEKEQYFQKEYERRAKAWANRSLLQKISDKIHGRKPDIPIGVPGAKTAEELNKEISPYSEAYKDIEPFENSGKSR